MRKCVFLILRISYSNVGNENNFISRNVATTLCNIIYCLIIDKILRTQNDKFSGSDQGSLIRFKVKNQGLSSSQIGNT